MGRVFMCNSCAEYLSWKWSLKVLYKVFCISSAMSQNNIYKSHGKLLNSRFSAAQK